MTAFPLALAALVLGAVLGAPRSGRASGQAAPANTTLPTISGTPQEKATLTTSNGTWSGTPTSYAYGWSRCDANGNNCQAIAGAAANSYLLQSADVGHTIRVTVTAKNADGSAQATSAPTAVVSSAAAPTNTAPPVVSGTVQVGSTLTVSNGNWNGNPTSYTYAWSRCDANGNSCATISGATANTYQLKQVDAGTTLRAIVIATNSAGSTQATSVPTAVVPAPPVPPATGCPSGTGLIQADALAPPARLQIDEESVTPDVVTPAASAIQLHFRVTACNGRPVQGVTVFAAAVPYNQYAVVEGTTGADGTVTMTATQQSGFPADRRQELLAVLVRASRPGGSVIGGISSRRLVSFPVSLHG